MNSGLIWGQVLDAVELMLWLSKTGKPERLPSGNQVSLGQCSRTMPTSCSAVQRALERNCDGIVHHNDLHGEPGRETRPADRQDVPQPRPVA